MVYSLGGTPPVIIGVYYGLLIQGWHYSSRSLIFQSQIPSKFPIWMWVKMEDLGDHKCECLVYSINHPIIGVPNFDPYPSVSRCFSSIFAVRFLQRRGSGPVSGSASRFWSDAAAWTPPAPHPPWGPPVKHPETPGGWPGTAWWTWGCWMGVEYQDGIDWYIYIYTQYIYIHIQYILILINWLWLVMRIAQTTKK